jgi:uncharacterized membrane protein YdcZ (DUF606 family)
MVFFYALSVIVGVGQVGQAGINKVIAGHIGLLQATILNNGLGMLLATAMYYVGSLHLDFLPAAFNNVGDMSDFQTWWLLPGFFGLCVVMLIPWGIAKMGAFRMFATMIAAELVFSIMWDAMFEVISRPELHFFRERGEAHAQSDCFACHMHSHRRANRATQSERPQPPASPSAPASCSAPGPSTTPAAWASPPPPPPRRPRSLRIRSPNPWS